jgi:CheY-like chemotaxis protein
MMDKRMRRGYQTLGVLTGNGALAALLTSALAANPAFRVRPFESCLALVVYANIARLDLIVADLDDPVFDAELLEGSGAARAPVIGLAREPAPAEGVAEVLAKPVSPAALLARVTSLLTAPPSPPRPTGNVIPLFPTP